MRKRAAASKAWRTVASVTVRNGPPRESDQWIFEKYALFLIINRHCADCMDDDTVSDALRKVRERIELPFEWIE